MRNAAQLVSTDSKRAQITLIPFSVETTGAQVSDTKLSADLSGLPANLTEKNVSFHETLFASCLVEPISATISVKKSDWVQKVENQAQLGTMFPF